MVQSRVDGWRLSVYCAASLGVGTDTIRCLEPEIIRACGRLDTEAGITREESA